MSSDNYYKNKNHRNPHQTNLRLTNTNLRDNQKTSPESIKNRSREEIVYVLKLTSAMQKKLQHLCVISTLLVLGYLFLNIPSNPLMLFSSPALMPTVLGFVSIWFAWQFLDGKLRFRPKIVKPKPRATIKEKQPLTSDKKVAIFTFFSSGVSCAFVLMIMIFLSIAIYSGTGVTVVIWNHFNELWIESIVFSICAVIVFVGLYLQWKQIKKFKEERQ